MKRIFEAFKLLIIGEKDYKDETIHFYKIDEKNEYIKNCLNKPIIKYEYVRTHIDNFYSIELKHKFINLSYIISKIDFEKKSICLVNNGTNKVCLKDKKIEIFVENDRISFIFDETKLNKHSFDENDDFYGKEEVVSFFNLIKEEIEKDINKLKM